LEYIQELCTAENISNALMHLLADANAQAVQKAAMEEAIANLSPRRMERRLRSWRRHL
jgi:lipid A disaccharide synthetase